MREQGPEGFEYTIQKPENEHRNRNRSHMGIRQNLSKGTLHGSSQKQADSALR